MTTAAATRLLAIPFFYLLFIFGLATTGLLGPDEPRYASIAREMAASGDWITPRLWGEPWFEKPPLLYWLAGAGYALGLGPELAPRLPVALTSIAFLVFYFFLLRAEFTERTAIYSTLILSTTAGWIAFSHAAATDLPLAATFGASMLLGMRWLRLQDRATLIASGVMLGFAVLAKGLLPLALALPFFWFARRHWRSLAFLMAITIAVAVPWYIAMTARHGWQLFDVLIWRHHVERFTASSLQHVRPFWFFIPVLIAGIFPWSPLLVLLSRQSVASRQRKLLAALAVFGFVLFSASKNKLPSYVLPLLPFLCVLFGAALAERERASKTLAACGLLLGLVPIAGSLLPRALDAGLSRAEWTFSWVGLVAGLGLAALIARAVSKNRPGLAFGMVVVGAMAGVIYLKSAVLPQVDEVASARGLWKQIAATRTACAPDLNRSWRYGLNYYSGTVLPACAVQLNQAPR